MLKVSVSNGAEPVDFPTMVALRLPESGHFVLENLWAVLASCELKLDPGTGAPALDDDALNVTLKEQWSEADEYNAGWPSDLGARRYRPDYRPDTDKDLDNDQRKTLDYCKKWGQPQSSSDDGFCCSVTIRHFWSYLEQVEK